MSEETKIIYELKEGDRISLKSGKEVTFIEAKRTRFVFLSNDGKRYSTPMESYVKYLGVDAKYKEILAVKKSNDINITTLVSGDVFAYYNRGKLQESLYVITGARTGRRVVGKNIATGLSTNFDPAFTVLKIDLHKFIKENNI